MIEQISIILKLACQWLNIRPPIHLQTIYHDNIKQCRGSLANIDSDYHTLDDFSNITLKASQQVQKLAIIIGIFIGTYLISRFDTFILIEILLNLGRFKV